jgi:hypothetical protein
MKNLLIGTFDSSNLVLTAGRFCRRYYGQRLKMSNVDYYFRPELITKFP